MDNIIFVIIISVFACWALYGIVAVLLYLLSPRCYICGRHREKYLERVYGNMHEDGTYDSGYEERYYELMQCPKCGKWTCYKCWHYGVGCCKNDVPEWVRRVDEARRLEKEQEEKERTRKWKEEELKKEEEIKKQIEERQLQELKEQQEIAKQRKCHICQKIGSKTSELCSKCNQWTCTDDIYHQICRRCWER